MKTKKLLILKIFACVACLCNDKVDAKLFFNDVYKYHCALKDSITELDSDFANEKNSLKTKVSIDKLNLMLALDCGYLMQNLRKQWIAMDLAFSKDGIRNFSGDKPFKKEEKNEKNNQKKQKIDIQNNSSGRIAGLLRLLFPSPSGNLSVSANVYYSQSINAYMSPEKIAELFKILLSKKSKNIKYNNWQRKFFETKDSDPKMLKKMHDYIDHSVEYIKNNGTKEEIRLLNIILMSYVVEKLDNLEELQRFVKKIDEYFYLKDFYKKFLDSKSLEANKEKILSLSKIEESNHGILLSNFASYVNWRNSVGDINPTPYLGSSIISNGSARYLKEDGSWHKIGDKEVFFSDCAETAFRHICNYMFFDQATKSFVLPKSVQEDQDGIKAKFMREFFNLQTYEKANDGSIDMRTDWNKVISHIPNVRYVAKLYDKNEIDTGIVNMIVCLSHIIGKPLDSEKIKEFYESANDNNINEKITKKLKKILAFMGRVEEEKISIRLYNIMPVKVLGEKNLNEQSDVFGEIFVKVSKVICEKEINFAFKIKHTSICASVKKEEENIESPSLKKEYDLIRSKIEGNKELEDILFLISDLDRENEFENYNKNKDLKFNPVKVYGLQNIGADYISTIKYIFSAYNKIALNPDYSEYKENIRKTLKSLIHTINFSEYNVINFIIREMKTTGTNFKNIADYIGPLDNKMETPAFFSILYNELTIRNLKLFIFFSSFFNHSDWFSFKKNNKVYNSYIDIDDPYDLSNSVKELKFYPPITSEYVLENFLIAFKIFKNVESIILRNCHVRDNTVKLVIELLKEYKNLESLDLFSNFIGDEGAILLAEYLKTNTSLKSIDLFMNSIGDEGKKALNEVKQIRKGLWIDL